MNSILSEYYFVVDSLSKELSIYKSDQNELKVQLLKLIEYNRKLNSELKESIQIRIRNEKEIETLRQQLDSAIQHRIARDSILLHDVSKSNYQNPDLSEKFEKRIIEIKEHYSNGTKVLFDELSKAEREMNILREKGLQNTKELKECQEKLHEAQEIITKNEIALKSFEKTVADLKESKIAAEAGIIANEKLIQNYEKENSNSTKQNIELLESNGKLTAKISVLEKQNLICEERARKCFLEAQSAVMETKVMAFKEQLALKFSESLKTSINEQVEQSVAKHKDNVKLVKKEYKERISCLMKETSNLQMENSRKQSLYEKAIREKFAIESKLKASNNSETVMVSGALFDEVCFKLSHTEKAKDEALMQVRALERTLSDLQQATEKESQYLLEESGKLKDEIKQLKQQFNEVLQTKLSLANEVAELKSKYSNTNKQLLLLDFEAKKEITFLKLSSSKLKTSFEKKLHSAEELYQKQMCDVRELMEHQNIMNSKWKDTIKDLTIESEAKIKEMVQYISQLEAERQQLIENNRQTEVPVLRKNV